MSRQLATYGETCTGMEQYAIKKFAEALTSLPRQLGENSGAKGRDLIAKLVAAHEKGERATAVDVEDDRGGIVDAQKVTDQASVLSELK